MEISMSQLGYMYSVATRQYQETSGDATVAYSSSQTTIDPSLDNVRSFISKRNYDLSIEERQKLMASYSDVLTKFVSENDVSDVQSDDNTTLDTNAVRQHILRLRILVRNHQTDLIMRSRAAIRRVHLHW